MSRESIHWPSKEAPSPFESRCAFRAGKGAGESAGGGSEECNGTVGHGSGRPGGAIAGGSARRQGGARGQSLIEICLIVPLMFLLFLNTVNFGAYLFAGITVADASRTGAEYAAVHGGATYTQISNLVTNSVSSLWNRSSVTVEYCTNANGTIACQGTGPGSPPADPESSSYILASVDVTYAYNPLIATFNFSKLGISLTMPSSTVHRRTVMRVMP